MVMKNYKLLLIGASIIILILGALVFIQPAGLSKAQKRYEAEVEKNKVMISLLEKERSDRRVEQFVMNHNLDSLQKAYTALLLRAQSSESEYIKITMHYKYLTAPKSSTDSVSVVQCDSVVRAADNYIGDLKSTLSVCDSVSRVQGLLITSLVADTVSYGASIKYLNSVMLVQDNLIRDLERSKLSWWNKNKFWVGFVSGAITTTATVFLVNKYVQ
jgi:hypothetical protein